MSDLPEPVLRTTQRALRLIEQRLPGYLDGLYLHGSLCWGEFFADSDIDFVATTTRRPGEADVAHLQQVHRELNEHEGPAFDGFYLPTADLAADPSTLAVQPGALGGRFAVEHHGDALLVTWHELAQRGITVHGPDLDEVEIFTNQAVLEMNTRTNLLGYWTPRADLLATEPGHGTPADADWNVLGILRLHHLLTEHELVAKSAAGRWGLRTMPDHRPIIESALQWRERGEDGPHSDAFDDDTARQQAIVDLMAQVLASHELPTH